MTKLTKDQARTKALLLSARAFSRRTMLKGAAAAGAIVAVGPMIVKDAFSSSGEMNYMGWAGYDYSPVIDPFTAKTGIKVNFTEQPDNDTIFAQAKLALQTGAFDVIEPTVDRVTSYVENGIVAPWDTSKINMANYLPGLADGSAGEMATVDGGRYFVPGVWGTEALVYNKDEHPTEYGKASLADLWADNLEGKVTVRAHSALAALGRVMDGEGKLPKPFMDSYKDDNVMKENWDVILAEALKHKKNIVQFWKGENEAQAAFRTNGAVLGLCWDSTGFNMGKEGPYGYISPKEGAFAWNQGYMLLKNAKNAEQGHAWANWMTTPEGAAAMALVFSANPVAKGAIDLADATVKDFYNSALPGDATSKLWWWPVQTSSYLKLRAEYADKFIAG